VKYTRYLSTALIVGGLLLVTAPFARYALGTFYQVQEQPAMIEEPAEEPEPTAETPLDPQELPQANGILEIPKISLKVLIVQGVTPEHLKRGPGFYPHSWHPEYGNVSIAGHRTGYAGWFKHINRLEAGDEIQLILAGKLYRYAVREQFVTHNKDWSVINSVGQAELTLTTCLLTTNKKRLIVKAELTGVEDIKPGPVERN
jgi:sortase A